MSVLVLVSDRFENNGYNFNDSSLTALRNAWCSRDSLISDFFEYLVKYQGMLFVNKKCLFRNWQRRDEYKNVGC